MRPNQADLIRLRPYLPLLIKVMRIVAAISLVGSLIVIAVAVTGHGFTKSVAGTVWREIGNALFMVGMLIYSWFIERLLRNTKRRRA